MKKRVRVAVVDNHPVFRIGVAELLRKCSDLDVVAEGGSCSDTQIIFENEKPDILIIDLNMPGDVLAMVRLCANGDAGTRIVVLTASDDHENVSGALDAGVRGYLLKTESAETIVNAVRSIFGGETYVTPSLAARLFNQMKNKKSAADIRPELKTLTQRETEILYCVGLGLMNKEIARELKISEKTVKHHMTVIMSKLQVQNRVQAALVAQKSPTFAPNSELAERLAAAC